MTPRLIFVADDDPDDLFFARRAIEKAVAGAKVITCADGEELVASLKQLAKDKQSSPQAVFLDIKMPNLDGFQTLSWIRRQPHLQSMPVVMLSGSAESRDMALARSLGANDYFVKYPPIADFARILEPSKS